MKTSERGISLIKEFEGLRTKAYQDSVGVWTIGYGHTKNVKRGMVITEQHATDYLKDDLQDAEQGVRQEIIVPLTQGQFDALVSFVFNLGQHSLHVSSLRKYLNNGQYDKAANEFPKWCHAGKKVLPGLVRRRNAEKQLFNS